MLATVMQMQKERPYISTTTKLHRLMLSLAPCRNAVASKLNAERLQHHCRAFRRIRSMKPRSRHQCEAVICYCRHAGCDCLCSPCQHCSISIIPLLHSRSPSFALLPSRIYNPHDLFSASTCIYLLPAHAHTNLILRMCGEEA